MIRLLLLLLGMLTSGGASQRPAPRYVPQAPHRGGAVTDEPPPRAVGGTPAGLSAGPATGWSGGPSGGQPGPPRPRRRLAPWVMWAGAAVLAGTIFRRAVASLVLTALSAALHVAGVNVHLPRIPFAWPWQTVTAGTPTNAGLGPWVLQKIEGISRPALGQANFTFLFTHKVSKNIGPWPCWYASTFSAVGRASATVDLNPGPRWWAPATGHYRLRVLKPPAAGEPGHVVITMVLPRPQLPRSVHAVAIDDIPSRPIASQHSWTYPGLGCGVLIRPQFPQSVLYAQAQRIAYYKSRHAPQVTGPLIRTAEAQAARTIRDNFVQPTVNALGYTLDRLTVRWTAGP